MSVKYPPGCIFTFDNIFNDDECDFLIKMIDKYAIIDGEVYEHRRNVFADSINSLEIPDTEERKKVIDLSFEKILGFCRIFKNPYDIDICGFTSPILRKIKGPTRKHIDGVLDDTSKLRNMSVIIALNDDYEGGEICFPVQSVTIKLKKGQAVAFPPYWTHPHYTNELIGNTFRYTLNFWTYE